MESVIPIILLCVAIAIPVGMFVKSWVRRHKFKKKYKVGKIFALDEKFIKIKYGIEVREPILVIITESNDYLEIVRIDFNLDRLKNWPMIARYRLYLHDTTFSVKHLIRELTPMESAIYE